jgi:hypothetical protein
MRHAVAYCMNTQVDSGVVYQPIQCNDGHIPAHSNGSGIMVTIIQWKPWDHDNLLKLDLLVFTHHECFYPIWHVNEHEMH